jgi:Leucine-rich repeat (LRR) protein
MFVTEEDMHQLTRFTGLLLHSNSLTSLPSEISTLMQLKVLTLNSNQITEIPSELMKLTNLMELSFSRNPCSVPADVFTLEKLTRLGCGGCGVALTQISTSIGNNITLIIIFKLLFQYRVFWTKSGSAKNFQFILI